MKILILIFIIYIEKNIYIIYNNNNNNDSLVEVYLFLKRNFL